MAPEVQQSIKTVVEGTSIWGVSIIGWFSLLQPGLTALATILAIVWTVRQLYVSFKKDES